MSELAIHMFPCLADNYGYLLHDAESKTTAAVDTPDAEEIAQGTGIQLKVLEREDCANREMGAYLGVAQGSQEPPKFIHLTYTPKGKPRLS